MGTPSKALRFLDRWVPGRTRPRLKGYWIWVENEAGQADPVYAQHLELLQLHPAFRGVLEKLKKSGGSTSKLARVAATWQLTPGDLAALIDDEAPHLTPEADKVFVELKTGEFVVHIPRPVTVARRAAIEAWLRTEPGWRDQAHRSGLAPAAVPPDWRGKRTTKRISAGDRELSWYRRWLEGESPQAIYDSLPLADALSGIHSVRNPLIAIHERMREISPEGLPEHGP